jgi:hypothetical protein
MTACKEPHLSPKEFVALPSMDAELPPAKLYDGLELRSGLMALTPPPGS